MKQCSVRSVRLAAEKLSELKTEQLSEVYLLGEGILKGLAETAKNFAGSFVSAERLTTVQYPEERIAPIEATRDFPFLVYDGDGLGGGSALRGLPDLRERMSAEVHLYRENQGQEAGLRWASRSFIRRVSTSIFRSA